MNVDIRYKPSFATLFVTLDPGDTIIAEADAMASMTSNVAMETKFNGGFFNAVLKKFLGGESLFVNHFSCEGDQPAELVLTQPTPGDIETVELEGNMLFMQPGAYIASGPGVKLGVGWAGIASYLGGEGLFRLKVYGNGPVYFGGYGGLFERPVTGEYIVDTGHLIAYEPSLVMKIALSGGIFSSFFGGEGFVSRLIGDGKIYMQSRSMDGLAAWTNHHIW